MTIRRAKIIDDRQLSLMLNYIRGTRTEDRDRVFIYLSTKAGLRAQEIALLNWSDVSNPEGEIAHNIFVNSEAAKGDRSRTVPMHGDLREALILLRIQRPNDIRLAYSVKRGYDYMSPNGLAKWFHRFYQTLGFEGCSSHSGRRTFGTNAAQRCNLVGASLRDVQKLMGHKHLDTTENYIEVSEQSRDLVEII